MKTLRLLAIFFIVTLVISAWAPAPASAIPSAKDKVANLVVNNRTGGSLSISLSGSRSYYFSTSNQGKTTFSNIEPGRYTITVRASAFSDTLTYKMNVKGTATLTIKAPTKTKSAKLGNLVVDNRTGGSLYVTLSGPRNYYFSTSKQGRTTFSGIEPGKYTITVRSSACSGILTYNKNMKGTAALRPFICR